MISFGASVIALALMVSLQPVYPLLAAAFPGLLMVALIFAVGALLATPWAVPKVGWEVGLDHRSFNQFHHNRDLRPVGRL
jgi:hypothetical protein